MDFPDVLPTCTSIERLATLRPWEELIADPTLPNPIDTIFAKQVSHLLGQILDARLSPREAQVLRLRFGIPDGDGNTREVVGERVGLSAERIRQIENTALQKLRTKPSVFRALKSLHSLFR